MMMEKEKPEIKERRESCARGNLVDAKVKCSGEYVSGIGAVSENNLRIESPKFRNLVLPCVRSFPSVGIELSY